MIKSFEDFKEEVQKFVEVLNANLTEKVGESVTRVESAFPENGSYVYIMVPFVEIEEGNFEAIADNLPKVLKFDDKVGYEGVIVFKLSTSISKVEVSSNIGDNQKKFTSNLYFFLNPDIVYEMLDVIEKVRKKVEMKKKIKDQISQVNAL